MRSNDAARRPRRRAKVARMATALSFVAFALGLAAPPSRPAVADQPGPRTATAKYEVRFMRTAG